MVYLLIVSSICCRFFMLGHVAQSITSSLLFCCVLAVIRQKASYEKSLITHLSAWGTERGSRKRSWRSPSDEEWGTNQSCSLSARCTFTGDTEVVSLLRVCATWRCMTLERWWYKDERSLLILCRQRIELPSACTGKTLCPTVQPRWKFTAHGRHSGIIWALVGAVCLLPLL